MEWVLVKEFTLQNDNRCYTHYALCVFYHKENTISWIEWIPVKEITLQNYYRMLHGILCSPSYREHYIMDGMGISHRDNSAI